MLVSFVIPCYGSQKTIELVVNEIIGTMEKEKSYHFEIILVNDSSPDDVYSVLINLAKDNAKIKVIDLANNFGQHSALMAGYSNSNGDIVVSLDDDGQSPVSNVIELINELNKGYDVVIAKYLEKKQSTFKNFGSAINDMMAYFLLGKPKSLKFSSFFVMKSFIVEEILKYHNPYPYLAGLVLRSTNKIANVELENRERVEGQSTYTVKKLLSLWLNGFTAFSLKPLRIATFLGAICSLCGFLYGIWIISLKLFTNSTPLAGYSSMMAVIVFIGGMLMLMLGIIGEYLGRIYISINNAPQYVIREKIKYDNKDKKEKVII